MTLRQRGPAVDWRPGHGYSLIELTFVAGLVAVLSSVAVAPIGIALDELHTSGMQPQAFPNLLERGLDSVFHGSDDSTTIPLTPTSKYDSIWTTQSNTRASNSNLA